MKILIIAACFRLLPSRPLQRKTKAATACSGENIAKTSAAMANMPESTRQDGHVQGDGNGQHGDEQGQHAGCLRALHEGPENELGEIRPAIQWFGRAARGWRGFFLRLRALLG